MSTKIQSVRFYIVSVSLILLPCAGLTALLVELWRPIPPSSETGKGLSNVLRATESIHVRYMERFSGIEDLQFVISRPADVQLIIECVTEDRRWTRVEPGVAWSMNRATWLSFEDSSGTEVWSCLVSERFVVFTGRDGNRWKASSSPECITIVASAPEAKAAIAQ